MSFSTASHHQFIYIVCMSVLPGRVYICTMCVSGASEGQDESEPLELELQMAASCHVGTGTKCGFLQK